jgi:integrase
MVRERRLFENPLAHLQGGNARLDRRRDGRDLEPAELASVLEAARGSSAVYCRLTGPDRYILYLTACATGFRAGELAELLPESFDLTADPPRVTCPAAYSKNRRTSLLPLPSGVAEALGPYLASKPAGQPIWPGSWFNTAAVRRFSRPAALVHHHARKGRRQPEAGPDPGPALRSPADHRSLHPRRFRGSWPDRRAIGPAWTRWLGCQATRLEISLTTSSRDGNRPLPRTVAIP